MSLSKIALFAFGLAAILVNGSINANANARLDRYYSGSNEELRLDTAKGNVKGG